MKAKSSVLIICLLAATAFAINPSVRVGKLKDADKVIIHQKKKDQVTIYGDKRVEGLAGLFVVSADPNRRTAGDPEYRIEFWRGSDKKPFDILWIDNAGCWGFDKYRTIYGQNRKICEWIEKAIKE